MHHRQFVATAARIRKSCNLRAQDHFLCALFRLFHNRFCIRLLYFVINRHASTDALLSSGPLGINPLHDPLSEDHGIRDDGMQSRGWPGAVQLAELVSGQPDFFVLSGVGVDSQKNEVSKSEKDAETSYHCCAQVSSKAEQSAVR